MKHTKKRLAALLCGAMLLSTLSGCGGSSAPAPTSTAPASGNREGEVNQQAFETDKDTAGARTLTFGIQNYSGGNIDPAYDTNGAWNASRYGVSECLFMFDNAMQVQSKLCDSYTVNDEHTEWVFHIREGVKFSDGCDLTAEAVKASFERLFEAGPSGSAAPQKFLDPASELIADNATGTLTVKTPRVYADLTRGLAYPVMAILDVAHTTDYRNGSIGTGPYAATNFREEVGYTMVANPHYWGGEVPYASIELLYMGDASAKAAALQAGQIDLAENVTNITDLRNLQADPNFTVTIASGVRCGVVHLNQSEGRLLANKTLRDAILMALDFDTMCSITVGGLYTSGFSCLPSTLDYGYNNLNNPHPFDTDKAVAMLDEAGIVDTDNDGIRELDGKPVKLKYVTYPNRCLDSFAEAVKQQLDAIGIFIDLEIGDSARQWDSYQSGDFDMNSSNWTTVGTGDPSEYMNAWYSKGGADYCGYVNAKYDELYEALQQEFDKEVQKQIVQEMQQILIDDAAMIPLGYYNSSMISNNQKVGGAAIHTADYYWITTEIYPAAK